MTATGKGAATRDSIVDRAFALASSSGLESLSIGPLAQAVGMSKSGVFAHFGSREDLQLADLDGDGKLDIIAAGRATKNVKVYFNTTTAAPAGK
jgi:AcrR family transcriptional regulator